LTKRIQSIGVLVAAGALFAVPTVGQAKSDHANGGNGHPHNGASGCTKHPTVNKGFTVRGTLAEFTADNPMTTNVNEASVKITVTGANRHARVSGELTDQNATKPGVQVKGGSYTVKGNGTTPDAFKVKLSGYEGTDTPSVGDKVRISGKIAVTRKKCAAAGTSTADRYGAVNVRAVRIIDGDPDA
jgi:hypothetical protein